MTSESNRAAIEASHLRDRRPVYVSYGEIVCCALVVAFFLWCVSSFATGNTWDRQMPFLAAMGEGAITDAGMVLPTLFTVVIGFYAALIGQSIAGRNAATITATRNKLGSAAQVVAALATVYVALTVVAAVSDPELLPRLTGIIVIWLVIFILGAGTGTFAFGTLAEQKSLADRRHAFARERAASFHAPTYSGTVAVLVIFATLVVLLGQVFAIGGAIAQGVPLRDWIAPAAIGAVFGALTLGIFGTLTFAALISETPMAPAWACIVFISFFVVAVALLSFTYTDEVAHAGLRAGVISLTLVVLTMASIWLPLASWAPKWKWLVGSAITSLASKWLEGWARRNAERSVMLGGAIHDDEATAPSGAR